LSWFRVSGDAVVLPALLCREGNVAAVPLAVLLRVMPSIGVDIGDGSKEIIKHTSISARTIRGRGTARRSAHKEVVAPWPPEDGPHAVGKELGGEGVALGGELPSLLVRVHIRGRDGTAKDAVDSQGAGLHVLRRPVADVRGGVPDGEGEAVVGPGERLDRRRCCI